MNHRQVLKSPYALSNATIYCLFVSGWSIYFGWLVKVFLDCGFLDNLAQAWNKRTFIYVFLVVLFSNILASSNMVLCFFFHRTTYLQSLFQLRWSKYWLYVLRQRQCPYFFLGLLCFSIMLCRASCFNLFIVFRQAWFITNKLFQTWQCLVFTKPFLECQVLK